VAEAKSYDSANVEVAQIILADKAGRYVGLLATWAELFMEEHADER
jgi:hypothetical protein